MDTSNSDKSTTGRAAPIPLRGALAALHWIAPSWSGSLARSIYFRPVRMRPTADQDAVLATGAELTFEDEGDRVVGTVWGVGAPVVLVHGWSGQQGQLTPFVAPLVSAGYQVITFDWPGHGRSEGRSSNLFRASRVLRAIEAQVGPLAGAIAHSFGAVAVMHACAHGLKVDRLVFHAPVARIDRYVDEFSRGFRFSFAQRTAFVEASERWLGASFSDVEPMSLSHRVRQPTHIIHSEDDREVGIGDVLALSSALGASVTRRLGLGHRRSLKDPTAIAESLQFLTARGAQTRRVG